MKARTCLVSTLDGFQVGTMYMRGLEGVVSARYRVGPCPPLESGG